MTDDAHASRLVAQLRAIGRPRDRPSKALVALVALVLVDTILMLAFWGLEGNPLLLAVGPIWATVIKIAAVAGLVVIWETFEIQDSHLCRRLLHGLTIGYGLVAVTNVGVVLGGVA